MKRLHKKTTAAALAALMLVNMLPVIPASADVVTNDQYVYEFLTQELGLNHAAASGLMANVDQECAFIPTAYWTDINGLTSYGLMQWNGPRFEQLKSFCAANGYAYDTLEGQLAFLEYDLTGPYSGYYDYLLYEIEDTPEGAYEAGYFWAVRYEVCSSIYVEPRANLAKDYYYPAYFEYAEAEPVVFENLFYAVVSNVENGMALTDDGTYFSMKNQANTSDQVWRFVRSGGEHTYTAYNCATGRSLSLRGENTAKWSFFETGSGLTLQLEGTQDVLGFGADGTVQLQIGGGSSWQSFALSAIQPPGRTTLRVESQAAPSMTKFSWDKAENAISYDLRIYADSSPVGTPVAFAEGLTEPDYKTGLPAGTYTAVLSARNVCGTFAGNAVTFTIEQQTPANLGEQFYAKISWCDAQQYLTKTANLNVRSEKVDYTQEQLWKFVRKEDGSYRIYEQGEENVLALNEEAEITLKSAKEDVQTSWMVYGDAENGYILQMNGQQDVLSVAERQGLTARPYNETLGQQFTVAAYEFSAPKLTANASGGVFEPICFGWNLSDCAEGYVLEVRDAEGLTRATLNIQKQTDFADITLKAGDYTAIISATSAVTGETVVSESVPFTVKNLPQRPVVGMNISDTAGEVSFYWDRCMDADAYSCEIRNLKTGEIVMRRANVRGFFMNTELPAGKYALTVTAQNDEGGIASKEVHLDVREGTEGITDVSVRSVLAAMKKFHHVDEEEETEQSS